MIQINTTNTSKASQMLQLLFASIKLQNTENQPPFLSQQLTRAFFFFNSDLLFTPL